MRVFLLALLLGVITFGVTLLYLVKFMPPGEYQAVLPASVRYWVYQLEDDDPDVRRDAADGLAEMGPDAQSAVPALAKHLADQDVVVRRHVAHALGAIGPPARPAVPALTMAMNDRDKGVLVESVRAVHSIVHGPAIAPPDKPS